MILDVQRKRVSGNKKARESLCMRNTKTNGKPMKSPTNHFERLIAVEMQQNHWKEKGKLGIPKNKQKPKGKGKGKERETNKKYKANGKRWIEGFRTNRK